MTVSQDLDEEVSSSIKALGWVPEVEAFSDVDPNDRNANILFAADDGLTESIRIASGNHGASWTDIVMASGYDYCATPKMVVDSGGAVWVAYVAKEALDSEPFVHCFNSTVYTDNTGGLVSSDPQDWDYAKLNTLGGTQFIDMSLLNGCPVLARVDYSTSGSTYIEVLINGGDDPADWLGPYFVTSAASVAHVSVDGAYTASVGVCFMESVPGTTCPDQYLRAFFASDQDSYTFTETFTETWSACTPGLAQFQRQGVDFLRPELEYYSDGAVIAVSQPTTVGNICRSDDRLPGYVTVYSTTCSDDSNPVDWRGYKVSAFSGGNIIPCPEDEYGLAIYDDSILLEELNGKLYLGYTFDLDDPEALVQNGFQNRVALKEVCGSTYPVDESDWSAELTFNWVYFNGEDGLPGYAGSLGLGHDPDEDILHLVSAGTLDDHDNPPLPLPEPFTFWHGELLP